MNDIDMMQSESGYAKPLHYLQVMHWSILLRRPSLSRFAKTLTAKSDADHALPRNGVLATCVDCSQSEI
jgi:hypothetical protein